MRELRIHHFFDIIRDYGAHKDLKPHDYGHSYHVIANEIYNQQLDQFRLVAGSDAVCEGCRYLDAGHCLDTVSHRRDFTSKEDFNNHLDRKIMKVLGYREGQIVKTARLIEEAGGYLDSITHIYDGNDPEHTEMRKRNVKAGIERMKRDLKLG